MKNTVLRTVSTSLIATSFIVASGFGVAASAPSPRNDMPKIDLTGGGLSITSADGKRSFNVHGLLMVNHSAFDEGYNIDSSGEGHFGQETELQTVRVGISGQASPNWTYAVQFANRASANGNNNDDAYVRRAYVTYRGWRFAKMTIGEQGSNFGIDNMPDPNQTYGTSYTMLSNVFSTPSGVGVNFDGQVNNADFIWSAGAFHVGDVVREGKGDVINRHAYQDETDMFVGRLGWTPYFDEKTNKLFFLQASAAFVEGNDDAVSSINLDAGVLGTRPNAPVTSAGPAAFVGKNDGHEVYNIGFAVASGPFSLISEYANLHQDIRGGTDNPDYDGIYVQAGWVVTGESRQFNKEVGFLGGVKPKGEYGAVEINGRLDYVDLRSNAGTGGARVGTEATTYTIGANWYINNNARLGADLVYLNLDGPAALENHGIGGVVQAAYAF